MDDKHICDCSFKKLETEMTNNLEDVKTMDERGLTEKNRKLYLNFDKSDYDEDHDASKEIIKREIASYQAEPGTGIVIP